MLKKRSWIFSIFILFLVEVLITNSPIISYAQIESKDPMDVTLVEYDKFNRDLTLLSTGKIEWIHLGGAGLHFFLNTSQIIDNQHAFWDPVTGRNYTQVSSDSSYANSEGYFYILPDRFVVNVMSTGRLAYRTFSNYIPDEIGNTGFFVVFGTNIVNFQYQLITDELEYANVDIEKTIILPEYSAVVSYAPTDEAIMFKPSPDRYGIKWVYTHREMDSKHDPLTTEVTYTFDEIFLQFSEAMYRNQKEIQKIQETEQRLDLLKASFTQIAFMAVILGVIAAFVGVLVARRKYKKQLDEAKQLPRRAAIDIEKSDSMKVNIGSLFVLALLLFSIFTTPMPGQVSAELDQLDQLELIDPVEHIEGNILWVGIIELDESMISTETIEITFPEPQSQIYIWSETSAVENFQAWDNQGKEKYVEKEVDRYIINDVGTYVKYTITQPYNIYNNSNILVFIDRFWLEYPRPDGTQEDKYYHADMSYNIILPQGATVYSASPSDLYSKTLLSDGRKRISFTDQNRQIDAFHDMWECQVTYSFVDVLDAINDLNADFEHLRVETQTEEELISSILQQVILFSILGLIAPILAFLIAYWITRHRKRKEIEQIKNSFDDKIFVESEQILAFDQVTSSDHVSSGWKAVLGSFWRLQQVIQTLTRRTLENKDAQQITEALVKQDYFINSAEYEALLTEGREIERLWLEQVPLPLPVETARHYVIRVNELLDTLSPVSNSQGD
jgi:heme/copper-type cytochrome/quinol oxidase subunit 2